MAKIDAENCNFSDKNQCACIYNKNVGEFLRKL